eukprot:2831775-Alexandrium_andersonii.AAC.1
MTAMQHASIAQAPHRERAHVCHEARSHELAQMAFGIGGYDGVLRSIGISKVTCGYHGVLRLLGIPNVTCGYHGDCDRS